MSQVVQQYCIAVAGVEQHMQSCLILLASFWLALRSPDRRTHLVMRISLMQLRQHIQLRDAQTAMPPEIEFASWPMNSIL